MIVESGSVSYGKATPYLPVIDLLKAYFKIQDRDNQRDIREKVTGKLLTLDKTLEPALPALLSLLDVAAEDQQWQNLDPLQRRQRTLEAIKRLLLRESQVQPLLLVFEDLHWVDSETQSFLDSLIDSLPTARFSFSSITGRNTGMVGAVRHIIASCGLTHCRRERRGIAPSGVGRRCELAAAETGFDRAYGR